jgi:hemerythrin-like domain-containing protein
MLALVSQIKRSSDDRERRDLADTLIAEIMRHAVAEEMYVYPAIEEHVRGGSDYVEHDKQEHNEIVNVMKDMEDVDSSSQDFLDLVDQLEQLLRNHASDEESDQFPKLRQNIPREKLVEMGRDVEKAKKLAPTRPHPSAPHSELFHKIVGPGVGMVDRLMDRLTGRHTG